jgi:hypothetical protein
LSLQAFQSESTISLYHRPLTSEPELAWFSYCMSGSSWKFSFLHRSTLRSSRLGLGLFSPLFHILSLGSLPLATASPTFSMVILKVVSLVLGFGVQSYISKLSNGKLLLDVSKTP